MAKGFSVENVDLGGGELAPPTKDRDSVFHAALTNLLGKIDDDAAKGSVAGGSIEFRLTTESEDGTEASFKFRLMLQQIDEQEECDFCSGTGIASS